MHKRNLYKNEILNLYHTSISHIKQVFFFIINTNSGYFFNKINIHLDGDSNHLSNLNS